MLHTLKSWPEYFMATDNGSKTFEVRRNDRDFAVGDVLELREYNPKTFCYTGRVIYRQITFVLPGGGWGIAEGVVVLGVVRMIGVDLDSLRYA